MATESNKPQGEVKAERTQQHDILLKLKYIGYCKAWLPPKEAGFDLDDFIEHAKFYLAHKKRILLRDPIWDSYTDEELLVEFFAERFYTEEEYTKSFKKQLFKQEEKDIAAVKELAAKYAAKKGEERSERSEPTPPPEEFDEKY